MSDNNNNLVYREQLEENVMEMLTEDIGSNYNLRTENQRTIVDALNEVHGKGIISTAVGIPLLRTDTFNAMETKLNNLLNTFRTNMTIAGANVSNNDKFKTLIDKIATLSSSSEEHNGGKFEYCDMMDVTLNVPRAFAGAGVYDGSIYVLGGLTTEVDDGVEYEEYIGDVEHINPQIGESWNHITTSMSTPRANFATVVKDGVFYCVGGENLNTVAFGEYAVFNASTQSWSIITSRPPLLTSSADIVDNTLHVFGYTTGSSPAFTLATYNLTSKSGATTTIAGNTYGHYFGEAMYINNNHYLFSGTNTGADSAITNGAMETYDVNNFKFTAYGTMKLPVTESANCKYENYIYCFGGRMQGLAHGVDYIQRFNLDTNTWELLNIRLNIPRFGAACAVIDGKAYCIGGVDNTGSILDTIEVCDLTIIGKEESNETVPTATAGLNIISATELPDTGVENQICVITDNPVDAFVVSSDYEDVDTDTSKIVIYLGNTLSNNLAQGTLLQITSGNVVMNYHIVKACQGDERLSSYIYKNGTWEQATIASVYFLELGELKNTDFFGGLATGSKWKIENNVLSTNIGYASDASGSTVASITTANMVNLTQFNTLTFRANFLGELSFVIYTQKAYNAHNSTQGPSTAWSKYIGSASSYAGNMNTIYTVDLSDCVYTGYIGFEFKGYNYAQCLLDDICFY